MASRATARLLHQNAWRLLALGLPLLFNPYSRFNFEPDKAALLRALAAILLATWAWNGARLPRAGDSRSRFPWPLVFLLGGLLALSTLFSIEPSRSLWGEARWGQGWLTWASYLLIFYLASRTLARRVDQEALVDALLFASLPVCLYGLLQRLGWDPLALTPPWERIASTMPHANALGGYLVMVMPFAGDRWLNGRHPQRWLWAALLLVQATSLFFTFSRSSWLAALAAGWLFLVLWSWQRGRRSLVKLLAITAVLALAILVALSLLPAAAADAPAWWQALTSLFRTSGPTVQIRLLAWQSMVVAIGKRPWLGYGLETLDLALPPVVQPEMALYGNLKAIAGRGHNEILEIALFSGIPAALVYVLLLALLARQGWRALRAQRPLALPLLVGLFAGFAHHMLDVTTITTGAFFWLYGGLLLAANEETETAVRQHRVPVPWRWPAVVLAVAAILTVSVRLVVADVVGRNGMALLAIGALDAADATLARAEAWDPRVDAYAELRTGVDLARGRAAGAAGGPALARAAQRLEAALARTPDDIALWRALLQVQQERATLDAGFWPQVYITCEQMLAVSPQNPDLQMLCGDVRLAAREPAAALDYYETAAALTPAYAQPFYNLATVHRWLGHSKEAEVYTRLADDKRRAWETKMRQR